MKYGHDETLSVIRKKRWLPFCAACHGKTRWRRVCAGEWRRVRSGITFDHDRPGYLQENAAKIRHAVERYGDQVIVGCGTALTVQEVEAAHEAGATLVISPDVNVGVIQRTRELGMVSMPGALTPHGDRDGVERRCGYRQAVPGGGVGAWLFEGHPGPAVPHSGERSGRREAGKREGFSRCRRMRLRRWRPACARQRGETRRICGD